MAKRAFGIWNVELQLEHPRTSPPAPLSRRDHYVAETTWWQEGEQFLLNIKRSILTEYYRIFKFSNFQISISNTSAYQHIKLHQHIKIISTLTKLAHHHFISSAHFFPTFVLEKILFSKNINPSL